MSYKYYRGIRNSLDDTKYKLQFASMSLKINENKDNTNGIKNCISGINDFSEKINDNETNISSNPNQIKDIKSILPTFEKFKKNSIKDNDADIVYNLRKINYINNIISKSYLKNVYNILLYNQKTQIDFRNLFFQKAFDINANKNDFIEINLKMDLEYEDISERNYVKINYEIFDENDNRLYTRSINNNKYSYFSNSVIVDEYIFYNFNKEVKKMKFNIKLYMLLSRVIKIWYIENNNYRLIIKHSGN